MTSSAPDGMQTHYVPKLVERCRTFADKIGMSADGLWHRLGIAEAIHTPEER